MTHRVALRLYPKSEAPSNLTSGATVEEVMAASRILQVPPEDVEFHTVLMMPCGPPETKEYWDFFHSRDDVSKRDALIPLVMSDAEYAQRIGCGTGTSAEAAALDAFSKYVHEKGRPKWACNMTFLKSDQQSLLNPGDVKLR